MVIPDKYPNLVNNPRMRREAATASAMIEVFCAERHGAVGGELCDSCAELREYAWLRLSKCPFQEGKTTCGNCRVHCYKPDMRQRAKDMMRTAGPRMATRHPIMTVRHFIDGWRRTPRRPS